MRRGRRMAWLAGAAAVAGAVLACGQLVGIGNDPPQGPVGPTTEAGAEGGFTYGQGDCAACVTTSCGMQAAACAGTPSCAALEGCMSGCGTDATCRAQCGITDGLGNDPATPAFEACLATSCSTECGLQCGGLAAVFPPATADACQTCIVQGPCASVTECAVHMSCQAALRCQLSSSTVDVLGACPPLDPDAAAPSIVSQQSAPLAGACSTDCSWGADWSCVGKVDWPAATLGPIQATGTVEDALSLEPIVGATVKVCNLTDLSCTSPIVHRPTDDAGSYAMTIPGRPVAAVVYADISSPAIVSLLEFPVAPFSESHLDLPGETVSPTVLALGAQGAGVTLDPSLGVVFVTAYDCRLGNASGVQFDIDQKVPSTTLVYYKGGSPDPAAIATDAQGFAAFLNVPAVPTTLHIKTTPLALGDASSTVPVFVRDGGMAVVNAIPTP